VVSEQAGRRIRHISLAHSFILPYTHTPPSFPPSLLTLSITIASPLSTCSCRGQARCTPSLAPSLILPHSLPSMIKDRRDKSATVVFFLFLWEEEEEGGREEEAGKEEKEEEWREEERFSASCKEVAAR